MEQLNDKEKFLNEIEGRKDLLQNLSLERLKILDEYYDKDINEKKQKIKELKSKLQ